MTASELGQRMGARELDDWMTEYSIEPWGERRADLRMGISTAATCNVLRTRGQKAAKPSDFIPDFEPPRQQPQDEMWAVLRAHAAAHNAALKGNHGKHH